jgi:hypothetical protein
LHRRHRHHEAVAYYVSWSKRQDKLLLKPAAPPSPKLA